MRLVSLLAILLALICASLADTPAQCLYPDFEGPWQYYLGPQTFDNTLDCSNFNVKSATRVLHLNLTYPDVVVAGSQKGFWTRIYNQGAEIVLDYTKFFAFSYYETTSCAKNVCTYTTFCNTTFPGWYHDDEGERWGCFIGVKSQPIPPPFYNVTGACNCSTAKDSHRPVALSNAIDNKRWISETKMVEAINAAGLTWTAKEYPEYETKTIRDMIRRAGGKKSRLAVKQQQQFIKPFAKKHLLNVLPIDTLPTQWDWSNVSGEDFVSPVRDQGDCGSCYAFGTTAALENIVSCSQYSQGCEGGFPYLVGKFGEDFQHVTDQCFPYAGSTPEACSKRCNDTSQFVWDTNYYYVGGYFGACTPQAMMADLFYNGPLAVSFEVYPDFMHYSGGVYTHHNASSYAHLQMNPFQVTNHAVNLVGWGVDNGVPYWRVKNSWGTTWGENGFFRILRGVNECAIEEMAVAVTPVLKRD